MFGLMPGNSPLNTEEGSPGQFYHVDTARARYAEYLADYELNGDSSSNYYRIAREV